MNPPAPPPPEPTAAARSATPVAGVDAFTAEPFRGNPAAVCLLTERAPEPWMKAVAAEMNLSETAFVAPGPGGWELRWFTPVVEVDLCGHATLAAAHRLWETGRLQATEPAVFRTRRSGTLSCRRDGDWITMDFPSRPAAVAPLPPGLREALGCPVQWVGKSAYDYLVELPDASTLRALQPDHAALARLPIRGVIVTAPDDSPGFDFVSRFFAPGAGVAEDPVTGSAHCTLGPFWAERLGRGELRGWQASRRGGEVRVHVLGERVQLGGQAVTVWTGSLGA